MFASNFKIELLNSAVTLAKSWRDPSVFTISGVYLFSLSVEISPPWSSDLENFLFMTRAADEKVKNIQKYNKASGELTNAVLVTVSIVMRKVVMIKNYQQNVY